MKQKQCHNRHLRYSKQEITSAELLGLLAGKRVTLDCGHHYTIHPLSNVLVVTNEGKVLCAECWE